MQTILNVSFDNPQTWIQKNAELSPNSVNLERSSNRWGRSTTFCHWVMNYPLCCFISTRPHSQCHFSACSGYRELLTQFYGIHSVDVTIYHIHLSAHLFAIHASVLSLGAGELAESSHMSSKFYFALHFRSFTLDLLVDFYNTSWGNYLSRVRNSLPFLSLFLR